MSIISGFVLFFLIWWTVIFTTLPFGYKREEKVTIGHAGSAPQKHHVPRKMLATTLITVVLWYPLHTAFINFLDHMRYEARLMAEEDQGRMVGSDHKKPLVK